MAINSSKGMGKEGEAVGWPHVLGSSDCLGLDDGDNRDEHLWVRAGGRPIRQVWIQRRATRLVQGLEHKASGGGAGGAGVA